MNFKVFCVALGTCLVGTARGASFVGEEGVVVAVAASDEPVTAVAASSSAADTAGQVSDADAVDLFMKDVSRYLLNGQPATEEGTAMVEGLVAFILEGADSSAEAVEYEYLEGTSAQERWELTNRVYTPENNPYRVKIQK